jgi:DNA-binding beta-propeller fold protein YncE
LNTPFSLQFERSLRGQDTSCPPSGLAFTSDGKIIVADDFNHRIQIYNSDGTLQQCFGEKGSAPGQFCYPKGIALDDENRIYVADCWNHRIQVFDGEGKFIRSFGSCGDELGEMNEPYHLLLDSSGKLIVVERCNHRLQFFTKQGVSLGRMGSRGTELEEKLGKLFQTPPHLLPPPLFEFPSSIAVDSIGNYYISDSGNHRIVKFDPQWNRLTSFGGYGSGPGQFEYAMWLSIDSNDLLYVADLNNNRIQIVSSSGVFLGEQTTSGKSTPLEAPCLTGIDRNGHLYVGLSLDPAVHCYTLDTSTEIQRADAALQKEPENLQILDWNAQILEKQKQYEQALEHYYKIAQTLWLQDTGTDIQHTSLESLIRMAGLIHDGMPLPSARPALIKGLEVIIRALQKSRQKLMDHFVEWDEVFPKFIHQQVAEHHLILQEQEDEQTFNQALYDLESKERSLFRQSRILAYNYRIHAIQCASYLYRVVPLLGDSERDVCHQSVKENIQTLCQQISNYMGAKEKNEETLLQEFSSAAESQEKWASFLEKLNYSRRTLIVSAYLCWDLQAQIRTLKAIYLQQKQDEALGNLIDTLFLEAPGANQIPQLLMGFQEDWSLAAQLEIDLNHLIDCRTHEKVCRLEPTPLEVPPDYFCPVPYDTENMQIADIAKFQIDESLPFKTEKDGIAVGADLYSFNLINDPKAFAQRLQEMVELLPLYEEKDNELRLQLEELIRQEIDLNDQLAQVNALDKKSPISLSNNIEVVAFQASLLRRMILTLEINQLSNLYRLTLGTALLGKSQNPALAEPVRQILKTKSDQLKEEQSQLFAERKTLANQESQTNTRLESQTSVAKEGQAKEILSNQKQRAQFLASKPLVELRVFQACRKQNLYRKLETLFSDTAQKQDFQINWNRSIGQAGDSIDCLMSPFSPAMSADGNLWVPDQENYSIVQFSRTGKYLSHFGVWGESPGCLKKPTDVQIDSEGNLIVTDVKMSRITKFSSAGTFLKIYGETEPPENRPGQVNSISLDVSGNLWAADRQNNRLLVYHPDGSLKDVIHAQGKLNFPVAVQCMGNGDCIVGDKSSQRLKRFNSEGEMSHSFSPEDFSCEEIYVIAYSPKHGIFASDVWNHQILHLTAELELISRINPAGRRAGNLGRIAGMLVDGDELFVSDLDNQTVQVFDLSVS